MFVNKLSSLRPTHRNLFRRGVGVLAVALALVAASCAENSSLDEIREQIESGTSSTTVAPATDPSEPDDASGSSSTADDTDPAASSVRPPVTTPNPDPTPLPIDRDYRIGTLDNGLTYLLRSNDSPGGKIEIRLLVNAGSAQQIDGSDGSAHFLEHMMFNGTEKYPENDLTAQLQRLGIEFGPDVNAYTSFDETAYLLSASTSDPGAPEAAFDVLAQWASAATIEADAVVAERGVVRDEMRQRDETVDGIIGIEFLKAYVAGTPYEDHLIIGDADKVESTTPEPLRVFYDDWYRPDNMAVVVVGDWPLDELEARVIKHFSDLGTRTDTPPRREPIEVEISSEPQAHIITHPDNSFDNLSLDFPIPAWDTSTVGGARLVLMERAIYNLLHNRLNDAYQSGDLVLEAPPYVTEFAVNRELRYFGTNIQAADLAVALEDYMAHLLAAAENGFSEDDMAHMRDTMFADFNQELAALNSFQDRYYADLLSQYWLQGADIDKTQTRIARQRTTVASFTADELANHLSWLLSTSGPIVIAVGADESTLPSTDEMLDTLANLQPAEALASVSEIDELMDRPPRAVPTDTSSRQTNNGEVTTWTFDNGVKVSHRYSEIAENSFLVEAASSGGWSTFPREHPGANTAIPTVAVNAAFGSGVGPHDALTLERFLSTKTISLKGAIEQSEESFSGESATRDAEAFFQLLHLAITAPRVDEVGFRTAINRAEQDLAVAQTNADFRALAALVDLVYDGDPAQQLAATQRQIDALDPQTVLDIYKARLGKVDDLAVAIVGDLDLATAADLAARYLGTLPTGESDTWVDLGYELPSGQKSASVELGAGVTNAGILVFHGQPIELNATTRIAAHILQGIINNQITERIREDLGASYGGLARITFERDPDPSAQSTIKIDGDPTRLDEIRSVLMEELNIIAERGPTKDQFEQVHNVIRSDWNFVNNFRLVTDDLAALRYGEEKRLTADNRSDLLSEATPEQVQQLAARLYGTGYWIEVSKVLPE